MVRETMKAFDLEAIKTRCWAEWSNKNFYSMFPEMSGQTLAAQEMWDYCFGNGVNRISGFVANLETKALQKNKALVKLGELVEEMEEAEVSFAGLKELYLALVKMLAENIVEIKSASSLERDFYEGYRNIRAATGKITAGMANVPSAVAAEIEGDKAFLDEADRLAKRVAEVSPSILYKGKWEPFTYSEVESATVFVSTARWMICAYNSLVGSQRKKPHRVYTNLLQLRLWAKYGDYAFDVRERTCSIPAKHLLHSMKEEFEALYSKFAATPLGERWIMCMPEEDGLGMMGHYWVHWTSEQSVLDGKIMEVVEQEDTFFDTLGKLVTMAGILGGKAEFYGVNIDYPKSWDCYTCGGLLDDYRPMMRTLQQYGCSGNGMMVDEYYESMGCGGVAMAEQKRAGGSPRPDNIPADCSKAVDEYVTDRFTVAEKNGLSLNSRVQIVKAGKMLPLSKKGSFAYLMAIAQEMNVVKQCRAAVFAKIIYGLGIKPITPDMDIEKEIKSLANCISKKYSHEQLGKHWKNWDVKYQKIAKKIYDAMTGE